MSRKSRESRALLVPEQRQFAGALQPLGGERDRLGAVEDALHQVRRQEGELQRARDIADIGAVAPGDGADGERLPGSSQSATALAPRSASARAAGPASAPARPRPGARGAAPVRGAAAAAVRPPGTAGSRRGQDDGRRVRRLLQPREARLRPQPGPGELDPGDQQPERFPPGCRCRRIEPVGQLRDAGEEPGRRLGAAGLNRSTSLRKPGSRSRAATALPTAASISRAGMRQPVAPVATLPSTRSALT